MKKRKTTKPTPWVGGRDNTPKILKSILIIILSLLILISIYYLLLPKGRIIKGETYQVSEDSIEFLYDLTYENQKGEIIYNHNIFNKIFTMIDQAENFLIVDMFLFGELEEGIEDDVYRNLTQELTTHLINKKTNNPEMPIYFITDDFNKIKKPQNKKYFDQLEEASIITIFTPLRKNLNPMIKIIRLLLKSSKKILNHRKVVIADINNTITTLITSGNPHDQSSPNSNIAIIIKEKIWKDVYKYEKQDANINNKEIDSFLENYYEKNLKEQLIEVQYLADGGLMDSLYHEIDLTESGDEINIAMFYLSDKSTIKKLISASKRGVNINLILDTSDSFFAKKRFGIPNKPVAESLLKGGRARLINIRWYKSHGEQFHTKLVIINKDNQSIAFMGSSNLAKNNLRLYNLQSDVKFTAHRNSKPIKEIQNYFNRLWNNQEGIYTSDYSEYKSDSLSKKLRFEFEQFVRLWM